MSEEDKKETKNTGTMLPFGSNLRALVASSKILTNSDVKSSLSGKGIFISSQSKEHTIPLVLTALLSPEEFEDLKGKQRDKESVPKRTSRKYDYVGTDNLFNIISELNDIDFQNLVDFNDKNYKLVDSNNFQTIEKDKNKLRMNYTIERVDLTKDWSEQETRHEATIEITLDNIKKDLIISLEHSAEETRDFNNILIGKITKELKANDFIKDIIGKKIKFGDFTNELRVNFLLNFIDDTLDKSDTFKFTEITNVDISIDKSEELPVDFKWMEDKVSNMQFKGTSLHETEILIDNKNHSSLIISSFKINYAFETKSNSGKCTIEVEFPNTRGNNIPDDNSEFCFKIINISMKNKVNIVSAQRILYREFDKFKEECYKKTMDLKKSKEESSDIN